jgi:hypothetical protein
LAEKRLGKIRETGRIKFGAAAHRTQEEYRNETGNAKRILS